MKENGNPSRALSRTLGLVSLAAALAGGLAIGCSTANYSRGPTVEAEVDPDAIMPDIVVEKQSTAGALRVGFGRKAYTPTLVDAWVDVNGNAKWDPGVDTFTDGNGNGVFDGYWLAGFSQGRPAQSIHDDIEAVATVIDDGTQRIAFVALDAIGFMNGEVEDVRKQLPASLGITLLNVASTHNHEAPDLQGLWGKDFGNTGIDPAHMAATKKAVVDAVTEAVQKLTAAEMRTLTVPQGSLAEYVADTRSPEVFDPDVHVLEFRDASSKAALGRIVNWSNHPEALWGSNLALTADYPGYVRRGIDTNITYGAEKKMDGLGGVTVFLTGAIGGLLCPRGNLEVTDRFTQEKITTPNFEKARAIGYGVAASVIEASKGSTAAWSAQAGWNRRSRTFEVPATNQKLVIAAQVLKIIKRDFARHLGVPYIKTELHLLELGDAKFLMIPGELYPEIANGGVSVPAGADYPKARKLELPWRQMVPQGGTQFFVGLSNDAIGYIIPKTQWDELAPYTYGDTEPPYGETNSIGADTGLVLDEQLRKMLRLPVPDRGSEDPT
jgi:hypothetical protein